jgi:hypothetical protein
MSSTFRNKTIDPKETVYKFLHIIKKLSHICLVLVFCVLWKVRRDRYTNRLCPQFPISGAVSSPLLLVQILNERNLSLACPSYSMDAKFTKMNEKIEI